MIPDNIACMPLAVTTIFRSSALYAAIQEMPFGQGIIVDSDHMIHKWDKAELCLLSKSDDMSIPTNWHESNSQLRHLSPVLMCEVTRLYEYIVDVLPIVPSYLSIQKSSGSLISHLDVASPSITISSDHDLSLLKMLIEPEHYVGKLFFTDEISTTYMDTCHIPSETILFAWSNGNFSHGVTDPHASNESTRVIINIYGEINDPEYSKLLNYSYQLYGNQSIRVG